MTPEQQKEELSKAYAHAVAAACGYSIGGWSQDQSCIDMTIGADGPFGPGTLADPKLDLQLKCTSDATKMKEDHVVWTLERAHYDKLRARASTPKILVVLTLPPDPADWVVHSASELLLRRCAFWVSLSGQPDIETSTKAIHVPYANVFSPDVLKIMMDKISRGLSL